MYTITHTVCLQVHCMLFIVTFIKAGITEPLRIVQSLLEDSAKDRPPVQFVYKFSNGLSATINLYYACVRDNRFH